jgi:predicted PurR-regulated permease PerM
MVIGMAEKYKDNRLLVLLLLTGAVYFFLKFLVPILAPVLCAMLFVTIFGPLLLKLQQRLRIHRQFGAVLLLLLGILLLALLVWVLFSWIVGSAPDWSGGLDAVEEMAAEIVGNGCALVGKVIGVDSSFLEMTVMSWLEEGLDYLRQDYLPGLLSQPMTYVMKLVAAGGFLITFLIATVLLAGDYDDIMNRLLDREECHLLLEVICGIIRYIATFVKAQLIIMSVIGAVAALALDLCGVENGALWGLLAGILDALPFIGTGIVLVPLLIKQLFCARYGRAAVCGLVYLACICIRELLEPRLIGRRLGVSPVAILISLYAGIRLFGALGILGGPLGFVILRQAYASLEKRREKDLTDTSG